MTPATQESHLGGEGPCVGTRGVSKVCVEVGDGASTSDNSLDKEAKHGEHGQAAVL